MFPTFLAYLKDPSDENYKRRGFFLKARGLCLAMRPVPTARAVSLLVQQFWYHLHFSTLYSHVSSCQPAQPAFCIGCFCDLSSYAVGQ